MSLPVAIVLATAVVGVAMLAAHVAMSGLALLRSMQLDAKERARLDALEADVAEVSGRADAYEAVAADVAVKLDEAVAKVETQGEWIEQQKARVALERGAKR